MAYIQEKEFIPSKMGRRKGYCLQNCDKGFGIVGSMPSAKFDMETQRRNGTLHSGTPPINISVPVYCDTPSKYEHIVVWHHGVVYEDGYVRAGGLKGLKLFGWGECEDGTRVVRWQNDAQGFLPPKGYWTKGDVDARIGKLDDFLYRTFPSYFPKDLGKLKGNLYGSTTTKWIREFQRRTGLEQDGNTGPITYKELQKYGFKG